MRDESALLVEFMLVTYNIRLQRNENGIVLFPFHQRWLRGEEYGFLCRHYYAYTEVLKMVQMSPEEQTHPDEIYNDPQYGQFYFIRSLHLQYFGFPRRQALVPGTDRSSGGGQQTPDGDGKFKKFKWKKTNFKTPLPKHEPVVIYVTANTKNVYEKQCMMHAGSLC